MQLFAFVVDKYRSTRRSDYVISNNGLIAPVASFTREYDMENSLRAPRSNRLKDNSRTTIKLNNYCLETSNIRFDIALFGTVSEQNFKRSIRYLLRF